MTDTLAETIKSIRTDAGDSPADAAKKVGVSRQGYVKWELGDTKNMKLGNLMTFCDAYKVGLDELVRGTIVATSGTNLNEYRQAPSRGDRVKIYERNGESHISIVEAREPDPALKVLMEGYTVADAGLRRAMLTLAREAINAFEKRSERND